MAYSTQVVVNHVVAAKSKVYWASIYANNVINVPSVDAVADINVFSISPATVSAVATVPQAVTPRFPRVITATTKIWDGVYSVYTSGFVVISGIVMHSLTINITPPAVIYDGPNTSSTSNTIIRMAISGRSLVVNPDQLDTNLIDNPPSRPVRAINLVTITPPTFVGVDSNGKPVWSV